MRGQNWLSKAHLKYEYYKAQQTGVSKFLRHDQKNIT